MAAILSWPQCVKIFLPALLPVMQCYLSLAESGFMSDLSSVSSVQEDACTQTTLRRSTLPLQTATATYEATETVTSSSHMFHTDVSTCDNSVTVKAEYSSATEVTITSIECSRGGDGVWGAVYDLCHIQSSVVIMWSKLTLCCIHPKLEPNTVRCRYNVDFPPNPHNRHPIARPWGRAMGCLLWF